MSRRVLLLTIDRLGRAFLGPYGNTWLETPYFDQLAAESLLCEFAIASSPEPGEFADSLLTGRHYLDRLMTPAASVAPIIGELRAQQRQSTFMSDDPALLDQLEPAGFSEMVDLGVEQTTIPSQAASEITETRLFQSLSVAATHLNEQLDAEFVWIHTRGLGLPWDAPSDWRSALHDEEDPDPWLGIEPPVGEFLSGDHDEIFPLLMAYGAQVQVVDKALQFFRHAMTLSPEWKDALWIITSPRGYPMGEHGKIGSGRSNLPDADSPPATTHLDGLQLNAEALNVPLLVRRPETTNVGTRLLRLTQPHSLHHTILDWLESEPSKDNRKPDHQPSASKTDTSCLLPAVSLLDVESLLPQRQALAVSFTNNVAPAEVGLHTWSWFYRRRGEQESLFVKPDDIWEVNDVVDRCPEVVVAMRKLLLQIQERVGDRIPEFSRLASDEHATASDAETSHDAAIEIDALLQLGYE